MLDTVKLLKECDAGTKMAVSSIDDVLDKVTDDALKGLLQESKNHHKELERKIREESWCKYGCNGCCSEFFAWYMGFYISEYYIYQFASWHHHCVF